MLLNVWFENGWHTNCSNKWFDTSFDLCQQKQMQINYGLFGEEPNNNLVCITIYLKSMPSLITIFFSIQANEVDHALPGCRKKSLEH